MELATLLVVNAVTFLVLLLWLKRRVDRELSADRALEQVRKEIGDLITDLNATTERNITLIEERVKRLSDLLEKTDRKIGLLRKEAEKHDMGTALYNDIIERRRRTARELSTGGAQAGDVSPSHGRAQDTPSEGGEGASADSPEYAENSAGAGRPGSSASEANSQVRGVSLRNRVRDMHRAGLAAETIARKLGATLGEVELIIGLDTGDYPETDTQDSTDGKRES